MSIDSQAIAISKNRLEKVLLTNKLKKLEREKKAELRMLNNTQQRFKTKYSGTRLDPANNVSNYLNTSSPLLLINSHTDCYPSFGIIEIKNY